MVDATLLFYNVVELAPQHFLKLSAWLALHTLPLCASVAYAHNSYHTGLCPPVNVVRWLLSYLPLIPHTT